MAGGKTIRIGGKNIGDGHPVYFIAEIGSNHDGSLDQAKKLIEASARAGADAVKFQSFTALGLINSLKKDESGRFVPHPALDILKKLELPDEWLKELFDCSAANGIEFLSAPFDTDKVDILNKVGVRAFKIASGDITFVQLIERAAKTKKPIILSTGSSTLSEVREAVRIIRKTGNSKIALLHCVSLYPPRFSDSNIRAVATMKKSFGLPVGYSDHTPGEIVPLGSVALGANIIEKHITFDRNMKGPDHSYAMTVEEFKKMVEDVRHLEAALGSGKKAPSPDEVGERIGSRRSLYAARDIARGEVFREDMIKIVRHGYGLPPKTLKALIGKQAKQDFKKDELIR